ncbi:S24 family peptidase [Sphingomonas sp. GM_Shp_2]|uniref:LexA family protein n=1 Tax=Sphingomonas sp. GM_Shp_2 TaxID=2937380 RepID=UPI00226AE300|nr:S24 family peptidase [Sphingomonas sp. GM_Shp_2]
MEPVAPKLKALRERAEPKVTIRAMAEALGLALSTYAAYEDTKKSKREFLPVPFARRVADILVLHGIERAEVMELAGVVPRESAPEGRDIHEDRLEVIGSVAAGIWREQSHWRAEERYTIVVPPSPIKGAVRFAVRVDGQSMDKVIPPGSELECIDVRASGLSPRPGDLVIVERTAHDLTEMTCKRLVREDDRWLLRCESTSPEFQTDIEIGNPDADVHHDDHVRVIGIVVRAHQQHFFKR